MLLSVCKLGREPQVSISAIWTLGQIGPDASDEEKGVSQSSVRGLVGK